MIEWLGMFESLFENFPLAWSYMGMWGLAFKAKTVLWFMLGIATVV